MTAVSPIKSKFLALRSGLAKPEGMLESEYAINALGLKESLRMAHEEQEALEQRRWTIIERHRETMREIAEVNRLMWETTSLVRVQVYTTIVHEGSGAENTYQRFLDMRREAKTSAERDAFMAKADERAGVLLDMLRSSPVSAPESVVDAVRVFLADPIRVKPPVLEQGKRVLPPPPAALARFEVYSAPEPRRRMVWPATATVNMTAPNAQLETKELPLVYAALMRWHSVVNAADIELGCTLRMLRVSREGGSRKRARSEKSSAAATAAAAAAKSETASTSSTESERESEPVQ